ncbi:MAG: insulinase family protein [Sandaracinaceae bacterium]|nr:insulinase family protein [Sandaracinaceae bacterium]
MRAALALVTALALCLFAARAHAQTFTTPPRVERLPNGLTVISVPTDSPGILAYYTLVRVGSRDEVEAGHSGYAHLFEHMMFRGTERYPQDRYEATIQSFGADNNAYTTQDVTVYTITAPASALERIVEIEADRFQHLSYTDAAYRTETGAVRGEYDMNSASPFLRMWEALSELAFSRHTYGHSTLGYLRDIERMPEEVEYSRAFFRRFYTPDNCTVIAAGDVDHDALMRAVRARYGAWRGRRDSPRIPVEPEPTAGARRHLDWPAEAAPRLFVAWRQPAFVDGRTERARRASLRTSAALRVVHGLALGEPSPLYQRLVVNEQRAVELGSWDSEITRDPHLFITHATLRDAEPFDPIIDALQATMDALARGEVDAARLDAVKSHVRYGLLTELETPADVADLVARVIGAAGDLGALDQYLEELAAVSAADVARVAREYLTEARRFVVTLSRGGAQ